MLGRGRRAHLVASPANIPRSYAGSCVIRADRDQEGWFRLGLADRSIVSKFRDSHDQDGAGRRIGTHPTRAHVCACECYWRYGFLLRHAPLRR
jgi:hypothetical protein